MDIDDNGSSQGTPGESDVDVEGSENGEIASPEPMDTTEYEASMEADRNSCDELDLNKTPPPASPEAVNQTNNVVLDKSLPVDNPPSDDDESDEGDYNSDGDVGDISIGQEVALLPQGTSSPAKKLSKAPSSSAASHMAAALHDDHGELDYEEDVDQETSYEAKKSDLSNQKSDMKEEEEEGEHISDDDTDGELDDDDDCEEGEIKDASEKPDDEKDDIEDGEGLDGEDDREMGFANQPPVCRFFMYGTCNWGTSCRFIHPGIRTAGSYVEENIVPRKSWNQEVMDPGEVEVPARPAAPVTESAWERGLRQAKELRKKSKKRKETDEDFEEKRKNLSINTEDLVEEKPKLVQKDDNKENEREKIQRDPYYDGVFGDIEMPYNEKQSIEGWHGGGHFENFEVHWGGRQQPHQQQHPDQYPDFRLPEGQRVGMYKEKHGKNYRHYDRYNKRGNKDERYNKKFDLSHQLEKSRQTKDAGGGYNRGEQWADPWQRVKSPVRRKHSSSRSRSRSRRHSRSGSYSSSYSSSSYSSRSRSSSFSSRSSYSRSSSSSRSSSGSRSPSPSIRQRRPPPMPNPVPAKKHTEIPRSFITKAGPIVGSRSLGGKDGPPPVKQTPPVGKLPVPGKQVPHGKPLTKPPPAKATEVPSKVPRASGKVPDKPDLPPPKAAVPMRQTRPTPAASKPFHNENRPGRSIRRRSRTYSSGSSKSRSSSGSSSRSRSRSSSASSSSSSSSADSDNLYGDMASPTRSPSPKRRQSSKKRPPPADSNRSNRDPANKDRYRGPNLSSQSSRRHPGQDMRPPWKTDDKRSSTSQPATKPPVHTAKDPLKMQGQKSSIKLTLKSNKLDSTSALREPEKKRPAEEPAGPPPKKSANKSPTKEPKEPVRLTIPKGDKVIKPPAKEPPSKLNSSSAVPKTPTKSAPKPAPEPPKPPSSAPTKKKSTSSRREELLKQLKAVEDAIARKRTK